MFLAAAVATLPWLVVPVLLMRWAMRRNSWQLAFIPAFYQLAMAAVANLIPPDAFGPLVYLGSYNSNTERVEFDPRIGVALVSAGMLLVNAVWRLRRRLWVMYDATAIYAIAVAVAWPKTDAAGVFSRHMHDFFALFLCGGVALAAVWLPVQWLARRQYGRLIVFITTSLIIAGAEAAMRLATNSNGPPDQPYSWEGWYWVIPFGFYWAAAAVLLFLRRPATAELALAQSIGTHSSTGQTISRRRLESGRTRARFRIAITRRSTGGFAAPLRYTPLLLTARRYRG